jgi:hypothetical protein
MAKLISAAAAAGKPGVIAGHMLIGRGDGRPAYVLTVAPLHPDLAIGDRPLAMIVIVDLPLGAVVSRGVGKRVLRRRDPKRPLPPCRRPTTVGLTFGCRIDLRKRLS